MDSLGIPRDSLRILRDSQGKADTSLIEIRSTSLLEEEAKEIY